MKKIILLIAAFSLMTSAFAQTIKHCDVEIKPAFPNNTVIEYGDTLYGSIWIKNLGPDTLSTSDIVFIDKDISPILNGWIDGILPGDSVMYTLFKMDNDFPNDTTFSFCAWRTTMSIDGYTDTIGANDTACTTFIIRGNTTGIKNNAHLQSVNVYPNPIASNNILNIEIKDKNQYQQLNITIYDALGKAIYNKENKIHNSVLTIDLNASNITNGIYYLIMRDANHNMIGSTKFVK